MNHNGNQLPAPREGKKTHITNTKSDMTMRTGDSKVNIGRDSSTMHQEGSNPIKYEGPWRMSGSGKASEMGVLFKQISRLKDEGYHG